MTHEVWLAKHPYFGPIAELHTYVNIAVDSIVMSVPGVPSLDHYVDDFQAGVPLLQSFGVAIDLSPAETLIASLVASLALGHLPERLAEQIRALDAELHDNPKVRRRAVAWLLNEGELPSAHPGLLRYLGWTALARYLSPVLAAFGSWRNEERWLRSYCPSCGSLPAMAQLIGTDPGRLRLLRCGQCGTQWRYRRTGCPFCELVDDHKLAIVGIEGEGGLRIDYCESCGTYLKTYAGEGNEALMLADWTSLHLDVIARDRGLRRSSASLYEL